MKNSNPLLIALVALLGVEAAAIGVLSTKFRAYERWFKQETARARAAQLRLMGPDAPPLKAEAGVSALVMPVHTPRPKLRLIAGGAS